MWPAGLTDPALICDLLTRGAQDQDGILPDTLSII